MNGVLGFPHLITIYNGLVGLGWGSMEWLKCWAHPLDKLLIKSNDPWFNILSMEYYFIPLKNNIALPLKSPNYK